MTSQTERFIFISSSGQLPTELLEWKGVTKNGEHIGSKQVPMMALRIPCAACEKAWAEKAADMSLGTKHSEAIERRKAFVKQGKLMAWVPPDGIDPRTWRYRCESGHDSYQQGPPNRGCKPWETNVARMLEAAGKISW